MYICIYVYMYILRPRLSLLIPELLLAETALCGRHRVCCLERAKRACSKQTASDGAQD